MAAAPILPKLTVDINGSFVFMGSFCCDKALITERIERVFSRFLECIPRGRCQDVTPEQKSVIREILLAKKEKASKEIFKQFEESVCEPPPLSPQLPAPTFVDCTDEMSRIAVERSIDLGKQIFMQAKCPHLLNQLKLGELDLLKKMLEGFKAQGEGDAAQRVEASVNAWYDVFSAPQPPAQVPAAPAAAPASQATTKKNKKNKNKNKAPAAAPPAPQPAVASAAPQREASASGSGSAKKQTNIHEMD